MSFGSSQQCESESERESESAIVSVRLRFRNWTQVDNVCRLSAAVDGSDVQVR